MFRQPFSFASYVYAGPLKDNLQCMRTQREDQIGVVSDVLACNPEFEKRATNFQCYVDTCKESDSKVFGLMRRKFSGSKYQSSRCNGSLFNALGLSSSSPHVKSQKQLILLYVPLILDSLLPPFPMSLLISLSLSLSNRSFWTTFWFTKKNSGLFVLSMELKLQLPFSLWKPSKLSKTQGTHWKEFWCLILFWK